MLNLILILTRWYLSFAQTIAFVFPKIVQQCTIAATIQMLPSSWIRLGKPTQKISWPKQENQVTLVQCFVLCCRFSWVRVNERKIEKHLYYWKTARSGWAYILKTGVDKSIKLLLGWFITQNFYIGYANLPPKKATFCCPKQFYPNPLIFLHGHIRHICDRLISCSIQQWHWEARVRESASLLVCPMQQKATPV